MADTNVTFAKVVANPNLKSWAQAYNAGKLFAVISLQTDEEIEEKDYLNVIGKEILDTLEQEFFTLETKDLDSIKQAVKTTSEKIPSAVKCSLVVASYLENVLYLYLFGGGHILLKREEKLGTLLESKGEDVKVLKNASGYLQNGDIVILETKQFSDTISKEKVAEFLDNRSPSEISEHLAPLVHENDEAGAASIIIAYKSSEEKVSEEEIVAKEEKADEKENKEELEEKVSEEEKPSSPFYSSSLEEELRRPNKLSGIFASIFSVFKLRPRGGLNHPRKVILTIIIVILVVFIGSVAFAVKKQQDAKTQAVFQNVYPEANKKYEEGKSLLGLNEGLAQDSFNQAKKLLEEGKNKLPKNSEEEKKVEDLLNQVNQAIGQAPKPNVLTAKEVDATSSNLLNAEVENQGLYFSASSDNIYFLTSGAVYSLDKNGENKESIITNDSDWNSPAGLSNYFGNIYVVDKKSNQILKFAATDSGYSKSDYIKDNIDVNFSKAISMAIDSSVYVLSTDGSIVKFNKGNSEDFSVTGLDKDLSNPTRIFTTSDTDNVYILDNGNSRIVVLGKSGEYKAQYGASVVAKAKDFDIDEANNKAYVLTDGKVYELSLK